MTDFEIKQDQFSGPLNTLLELIEAKHLDITQVSLAMVTIDFLEYIKKFESNIHPAILADFLSVAAKLMLIKSKTLLPDIALSDDEEKDIKDLESRLELYRIFAAKNGPASMHLQARWTPVSQMHSRPLFTQLGDTAVFYPPSTLGVQELVTALKQILVEAHEVAEPDKGKIKNVLISLEEKVQELISRFTNAAKQSFKQLSENKSKPEIVVLFLAILHLLRQKEIHVEQEGVFSDIIMERGEKEHE